MPVVGTAGHVDHGKSTLVRALTGREPDRWEEERRRGLTIDLGFAWTTLPGNIEAGFVDVPGHERFIKNMLAGVDAIDVALFVVAADEGWMPQSEEHLQILDLLAVRAGVIALTRADLVDSDLLEIAEIEVRERVEGTVLADAPIVPTAAPNGRGVDEVASALAQALAALHEHGGDRPRLWVDRAFTIGGAGTVVTGTLVDGPVETGGSLVLWPGERPVRIRSLQRHEAPADRVEPGSRAALNLAGLEYHEVERGAMLGAAGQWQPTDRFLARVRTVRSLDEPLRDRGAFHLHVGSGVWPARLRVLASDAASAEGAVVLRTESMIPLKAGDRFIVREVGRRAVVAGGTVLDPHPPEKGGHVRAALTTLLAASPDRDARATALLEVRGIDRLDRIAADSGGGRPSAAVTAGDVVVSATAADGLAERAVTLLDAFHASNPLRPGMPKAELAVKLGIERHVLESLVTARGDLLATDGASVHAAGFSARLDEATEHAWSRVRSVLLEAGLAPPPRRELGIDEEQTHALIREGRLVAVAEDLLYLPETLDAAVELAETLDDGFTVSGFRTAAGLTRKHAVPLLEWLDRTGVTRRIGDARTIRRSPPSGPGAGGARSR
jgi:selenocysteine-specific elongation factor